MRKKKKYQYDNLADIKSVGEPLLTLLSGAFAEPISGLAALGTGEVSNIEKIQNALTYKPRTDEGKKGMQNLGKIISQGAEAIGAQHLPGYWDDEVIPALQTSLGDIAGSGAGAGLLGAMSVLGPRGSKKSTNLSDLYNEDTFHVTKLHDAEPFENFKIADDDIGIHTGTKEQANERFENLIMGDMVSDPGRQDPSLATMKLKGASGKSIQMHDQGSWNNPGMIMRDILEHDTDGGFKTGSLPDDVRMALVPLLKEWDKTVDNSSTGAPHVDKSVAMIAKIRKALLDKGYNKIKYANDHETPRYILDALRTEIGIHGRSIDDIPQLKNDLDIMRSSPKPKGSESVIEKKIKQQEAVIRFLKGDTSDIESTIWLDPKDLKSKNAKFKDRKDLMSSYGLMNASQEYA